MNHILTRLTRAITVITALSVLLVASTALAQTATSSTAGDLQVLLPLITDAFKSNQWVLAVGLVLTAVVAIIRKLPLDAFLPKAALPWIALGIALLGSVGAGLASGRPWYEIVVTGLTAGAVAIGGWETVGKLIAGLFTKKA